MKQTAQEQSEDFAVRMIRMTEALRSRGVPSALLDQVLRSGTSIGANLAEAQCGSSKRDFLSKVRISFKESAETLFWLRVLHRAGHLADTEYKSISSSARTLHAILAATIRTTARNLASALSEHGPTSRDKTLDPPFSEALP